METPRRVPVDKRKQLRSRVNWGRTAMLVIMAVSLINQILLLFHVNYHFLFSAAMPYYLNWLARELGDMAAFNVLATLLTVVLYGAYASCWLLSSQRREWLLAGLGLYGLDTLLLIILAFTLLENPMSCFFEILVHGVGLWLLFTAVRAAEALSRMPRQRRTPGGRSEQVSH